MKFFEIHKYPSRENFPVYGNINRLYIDLASNKFYYWQDGQYFKISTVELDQATRDEVEDIITAHTAAITNRLTELETSKVDKPAGSSNNYFSESNEYLPIQRFARVRYQSTSGWAKVAEVTLPANADERKSAIFFINCENNTSTTSESWFGILEWNIHETPNSNSIKWLVTYGFGENNFNIRYHADTNTLSFFVLPSVGNMNLWLASESTNGQVTSDIVLFDATSNTPRTGLSVAAKADLLSHAGHVRDTRTIADIALNKDISATALINALKANGSSDTDKLTTVELVAGMFAELVNGAPEALDTLHELAQALGDDPNFATTMSNLIGTKLSKADAQNTYETITNSDYKLALKINKMVPITYESLVALRDSASLIPGQQYRITDYTTTTTQEDTQSAGHAFDIIVVADSVDKLNENARAIQHDGDTYFANSKLEAWQVWYSLDNDTHRFAWADTVNGKGVIYRLIDEWNNDCPYDFKNMMFLVSGEYIYTFHYYDDYEGEDYDLSLNQHTMFDFLSREYTTTEIGCHTNIIRPYYNQTNGTDIGHGRLQFLNFITFSNFNEDSGGEGINTHCCYSNFFDFGCRDISFGKCCSLNSFGCDCRNITIENDCNYNRFGKNNRLNTIKEKCEYISFGDLCMNNTIGYSCSHNSFANSCNGNTLSTRNRNNVFGIYCNNNTFGNDAYNNSFGNDVYNNSFGNYANGNTFGNYIQSNSFGDNVANNSFGNNVSNNTFGNYFMYSIVKNYVRYVRTPDAVHPNYFQYVTLENGLVGASIVNKLNLEGIQAVVGYNTPIKVARGTGTEIVAVWQNGIALAGLRKEKPTTANWTEL